MYFPGYHNFHKKLMFSSLLVTSVCFWHLIRTKC